MSGVVFIGDEVSAAGYRLAGAQVLSPAPQDTLQAFDQALESADVVLLTDQSAQHVPRQRLDDALVSTQPLVSVVMDARGHESPANLEDHVRTVLGLEV